MNSNTYNPEALSSAYKGTTSSLGNMYSSTLEGPQKSWFGDFSWTWVVILVLLLALIGINIFVYLAKGTQGISDVVGPTIRSILGWAGYVTGAVTKEIGDISASGANLGIDVAKNVVDISGTALQTAGKVVSGDSSMHAYDSATHASSNQGDSEYYESPACKKGCPTGPSSDDAGSTIQASKGAGKTGWCYIGEDRGIRSCISVNANDTCMSGDIFPTQDVCINPSLRG